MGKITIEELDQSLVDKINSSADSTELERMNEEISTNKTTISQQGKDIVAIQKELGTNKGNIINNTIEIFNLY